MCYQLGLKQQIELDVLSIEDGKNYIKINLNQVNKIQDKESVIELYLDNDTIFKIWKQINKK